MTRIPAPSRSARLLTLVAALLGLSVAAPVLAQDDSPSVSAADARAVLDSLEGLWAGELTYRDYGTDGRVSIPMRLSSESLEGELVALRKVEFADPGRVIRSSELVRLSTGEEARLTVTPLSGDDNEDWRIESLRVQGPSAWTMVLLSEGRDADRPAQMRLTQTLDGNTLRVTKDVDYTDDAAETGEAGTNYEYRNSIELARTKPDTSRLAGTWTIDLRPTPDAPEYLVTMVIQNIEDKGFEGTFYNGSVIGDARLTADWDSVRFAFTTRDGGSTYHTQGELRADELGDGGPEADRIEGTSHAVGRDFLARWVATRAAGAGSGGGD